MTTHPTHLVTASDIATLAGVSRAAVSNWRRRHEDFPTPCGGSATKPLFDEAQVRRWLTSHGQSVEELAGDAMLWSVINTMRARVRTDDAVDATVFLMTMRYTNRDGWRRVRDSDDRNFGAPLLRTDIGVEPTTAVIKTIDDMRSCDGFRALIRAIDHLPPDQLARDADALLLRTRATPSRAEQGLKSRASDVLVAAAGQPTPGATIYDPTCGRGWTLTGIAATNTGSGLRLVGTEINPEALLAAQCRAALRDMPVELTLADVLRSDPVPSLRADVIVCEPPFGLPWDARAGATDPRWHFGLPTRTNANLLWIQHTIAHLTQNGRGFVLTSLATLSERNRANQQVRAELLRHGCVHAIVALPPRMLTSTTIPLALWVLGAPRGGTDDVLLIDATDTEHPEGQIHQWLTGTTNLPAHIRLPVDTLLSDNADLSPGRWVTHQADLTAEQAQRELDHVVHRLHQQLSLIRDQDAPSFTARPDRGRTMSVKDLTRIRALSIHRPAARTTTKSTEDPGVVHPRHLRAGQLPPAAPPVDGRVDHALTQPGDVLVCTTGGLLALVDHTGGHRYAQSLTVLRPDPTSVDPTYLAACLTQEWNTRFLGGVTIQRADINDLKVPLLPLPAQREIATQLTNATALKNMAKQIQALIHDATRALLTSVWTRASGPAAGDSTHA